jgi:small GTP-binding protein
MEKMAKSYKEPIKLKIKLCLLGDGAVGKTSLMERYVTNTYRKEYLPTIGVRTSKKRIIINDSDQQRKYHIDLYIWDIMGQISFRKILHPTYLKGASGALMICDLTRRETLEHLDDWVDSLFSEWRLVPMVFVANKSDLRDSFEFRIREMESFASTFESQSFITSAKSGNNIDQAFTTLGTAILKNKNIPVNDTPIYNTY